VVPKVGCTAPWGVLRGKGVGEGLEVGPSERVVLLLTIQLTSDQTSGNWYRFIKLIRRIKNLLTVK
jgi:hypothetical protein